MTEQQPAATMCLKNVKIATGWLRAAVITADDLAMIEKAAADLVAVAREATGDVAS